MFNKKKKKIKELREQRDNALLELSNKKREAEQATIALKTIREALQVPEGTDISAYIDHLMKIFKETQDNYNKVSLELKTATNWLTDIGNEVKASSPLDIYSAVCRLNFQPAAKPAKPGRKQK